MGHRACYILIKNEKERTFYYSRYGSNIMDHNILGGFSCIKRRKVDSKIRRKVNS